jgi:hypothetical protein
MQALACGYYLFYLSVLVGLWLAWFAFGRERWRNIAAVAGAWMLASSAMAPIAYGYLIRQQAHGLRRWPEEIESFSADILSVLKAPDALRLWGWLDVVGRPESALFPGLTIVVLLMVGLTVAWHASAHSGSGRLGASRWLLAGAAVFGIVAATPALFGAWKLAPFGLQLISVTTARKPLSVAVLFGTIALVLHPSVRSAWRRRSPLAFYTLATAAMWVFSLGPSPTLMNEPVIYKAPYAWLMLLPGVEGVRVPARFWVLGTLCLATAAALAMARLTAGWPRLRAWLPACACALVVIEAWPQPIRMFDRPAPRPIHVPAVARLELPVSPEHDPITLFRAAHHRRPVINGYSGYFAPHYFAIREMLDRKDPSIVTRLSSMGTIEAVVDHPLDPDGGWRAFLGAAPETTVAYKDQDYTVFRIGRSASASASSLPVMSGNPLPVGTITASLYQDLVGLMTDGSLLTRWHTGGPQDPTNEVSIDLGSAKQVAGVELEIGGYVADFPRVLVIETSADGASWTPAWSGPTALQAVSAAIEAPLDLPLRFPFDERAARFVRLRQTAAEPIYWWSIAEMKVFGQ